MCFYYCLLYLEHIAIYSDMYLFSVSNFGWKYVGTYVLISTKFDSSIFGYLKMYVFIKEGSLGCDCVVSCKNMFLDFCQKRFTVASWKQ